MGKSGISNYNFHSFQGDKSAVFIKHISVTSLHSEYIYILSWCNDELYIIYLSQPTSKGEGAGSVLLINVNVAWLSQVPGVKTHAYLSVQ